MKILHINTFDIEGGAARAVYRLHKALLSIGIDSLMLVQMKRSDDYTVIGPESKFEKFVNLLRPTLDQLPVMLYRNRREVIFSPAWFPFSRVLKKISKVSPDIVHLHWICGGMLRIEDIARIRQPIVWSLHDNWAFTGGCHYNEECNAYEKGCGSCPILGSEKENDLSRKVYRRKERIFTCAKNMTIVGLSAWITGCSKKSCLLRGKKHLNLPNPIDTSIFRPFDKGKAREIWNLPKNKKLVLFGAMTATSDPRKGFKELSEALKLLRINNVELVVFGSGEPKSGSDFRFKTYFLGRLYDDISLVTLYNAADVTVVPSLQENLSNVIMESLACGTPVVAFDIGGNSDMVEHLKSGYLATPFSSEDLAFGIKWVLTNPNYNELSQNARRKVLQEFDSIVVAKKYVELYREILEQKENRA